MMGPGVGESVASAILKKIAASVVFSMGKTIIKALQNIETDYGEHIRQSADRCSSVRTILNRDHSIPIEEIYVHINLSNAKRKYDDYKVIENLYKTKRLVVSGTGGGGKTIFMKYLWLSISEKSEGRVPLFIELRRFNEISFLDFRQFLFRSVVNPESKLEEKDFSAAMRAGKFSLILDGFDEIIEDRRQHVEKAILDMAKEYPNCIIVVSGRPDPRFDGWQSFPNFSVEPLNQAQVIDLISRVKYDQKIKKIFSDRIKRDLYRQHKSFLSNPLLATMMLLTFDQFADIPSKIHIFYEQAFDTLFAKHDAVKEAFRRKTHTSLPIDQFKKILGYTSLISYYEHRYEFNSDEIIGYVRKAAELARIDVAPDLFVRDLIESVCVIQRDGLALTFTHRSFQEFFAAYIIARFIRPEKIFDLCYNIIARPDEEVIRMFFDMNKDICEEEFIRPALLKLKGEIEQSDYPVDVIRYSAALELGIVCIVMPDGVVRFVGITTSRFDAVRNFIRWAYDELIDRNFRQIRYKDEKYLVPPRYKIDFKIKSVRIRNQKYNYYRKELYMEGGTMVISESSLRKTYLFGRLKMELNLIDDVIEDITVRVGNKSKAIDEIFG